MAVRAALCVAAAVAAAAGAAVAALPAAELAALKDVYDGCGGAAWAYNSGTEPFNRTIVPWFAAGTDPCTWFGVQCDPGGSHVLNLFPNPRFSGNPMVGQLPDSIGNLSALVGLYTSNDQTPSALTGAVPETIGRLRKLQCLYFSHNKLETLPASLSTLSELRGLFLRVNNFNTTLPDLGGMPELSDLWFDSNANLRGDLSWLPKLPLLRTLRGFLAHITGPAPPEICHIHHCLMIGNYMSCPFPTVDNTTTNHPNGTCCGVFHCVANGTAPPAHRPGMHDLTAAGEVAAAADWELPGDSPCQTQ